MENKQQEIKTPWMRTREIWRIVKKYGTAPWAIFLSVGELAFTTCGIITLVGMASVGNMTLEQWHYLPLVLPTWILIVFGVGAIITRWRLYPSTSDKVVRMFCLAGSAPSLFIFTIGGLSVIPEPFGSVELREYLLAVLTATT
jgi:hypothetical protein